MTSTRKPVAVVIGATSKWQSDGRNTRLIHGGEIDDSDLPIGVRWGVGGAIAQKFASEGFLTVLTTRNAANATTLQAAIGEQGGESIIVSPARHFGSLSDRFFDAIQTEKGTVYFSRRLLLPPRPVYLIPRMPNSR